ncbi:MAG TPA: hypothetical protein DCP32_03600 [Anaerolineaceae bacterium]|nr:MAG: hypothetical protein A2X24_09285 [Chloroflexi bacterium GWB2_54_36]HAL15854.1 hypothetical protein [Anaerolineaceae bacterium]
MAEKKKIKSLFNIAVDALTDRDEKAEAAAKEAAAKKEAAETEARRKAAEAAQARLKAKADADKKAAEAKAAAEKLAREKQLAAESKKRADAMMAKAAADARAAAEAAKPKVIAEYEVKTGDTLSALALKYYKHATPPYYTLIYETNKAVIGSNPNLIRPGMKLLIPELPEELKK